MSSMNYPGGDPLFDLLDRAASALDDAIEWEDSERFHSALLIDGHGDIQTVRVAKIDPYKSIHSLVRGMAMQRTMPAADVAVWQSFQAHTHSPANLNASHLQKALYTDIATGEFAACEADRSFAAAVLEDSYAPVLFGQVVVSGFTEENGQPASLSETFRAWLVRYFDQLKVTMLGHTLARQIRNAGVRVETIKRVDVQTKD